MPSYKITANLASVVDCTSFPKLFIADGSIQALKWLALLLMTGDHVNKYLLNSTNDFLFNAGRLAMPIFVLVFSYNLARPDALERGVYQRTITRLMLFGLLATPAYIGLGSIKDGWWPLNILFTLLALTLIVYFADLGTFMSSAVAIAIFWIAGASVEFLWPALVLGLAVWSYCRYPSWKAISLALAALLGVGYINGNLWAFAALPLVLVACCVNFRVRQFRWLFYSFYPAHLSILWLIRIPMRKAGYLFF